MSARQEKARVAERHVAPLRFATVVFNVVLYWPWLHPLGSPALAAAISVFATLYAGYVWLAKPYLRWPAMAASAWVTIGDGLFIASWIFATGGFQSPFYLLWYLSLVAVTFRFDWRATVAATVAYSITYLALMVLLGHIAGNELHIILRIGYIILAGAVGAQIAHHTSWHLVQQYRMGQQLSEVDHLRKLSVFRQNFISTAAHELRTPLTPMRSQVLLLRKMGDATGQQAQALDILDRNLERMSGLVEDLLLAARNQSGDLGIEPKRDDLHAVVKEEVEGFKETARARNVRLQAQTEGDGTGWFDRARISQVLDNLLTNAIKFTGRRGRVVVRSKAKRGVLEVQVSDTGKGIRGRDLEQLFQPFSQVHDTHEMSSPGSGLGLYICKAIIDLHGGQIKIESPGLGKGTTVTFTIPRRLTRSPTSLTASSRPTALPAKGPGRDQGTPPGAPTSR